MPNPQSERATAPELRRQSNLAAGKNMKDSWSKQQALAEAKRNNRKSNSSGSEKSRQSDAPSDQALDFLAKAQSLCASAVQEARPHLIAGYSICAEYTQHILNALSTLHDTVDSVLEELFNEPSEHTEESKVFKKPIRRSRNAMEQKDPSAILLRKEECNSSSKSQLSRVYLIPIIEKKTVGMVPETRSGVERDNLELDANPSLDEITALDLTNWGDDEERDDPEPGNATLDATVAVDLTSWVCDEERDGPELGISTLEADVAVDLTNWGGRGDHTSPIYISERSDDSVLRLKDAKDHQHSADSLNATRRKYCIQTPTKEAIGTSQSYVRKSKATRNGGLAYRKKINYGGTHREDEFIDVTQL